MTTKNKSMNIFTESRLGEALDKSNRAFTIDWRTDVLDSIVLTGTADSGVKVILANRQQVLDFSSSLPRLKRSLIKKFQLILSQPTDVGTNHSSHIRCSICNSLISWPAWYHLIKYAGNCFACFICFDSSSPNQPSTRCYRRG